MENELKINVILGGFALFLWGIKQLGDGFREAAGPKIRDYIAKYTGSLMSSIIVGTIITALMQSSTAATVISLSLVRANLMTAKQAIGISVGANLGTTVTALMTGLNIEAVGYYFTFIGVIALFLTKKKKHKSYGQVLFGFGITFVGLDLMGEQLLLLKDYPQFEAFLVQMSSRPWLALLAGTVATAVTNSSMAVVVLVQKIYAGGGMSMAAASGFVFGSNIGTTLTAVLASVGASADTKRAGWFHALYNVLGAVLTMFFVHPYSNFILWLNEQIQGSPEMAIGLNHFVFNLLWVFAIIPFIPASIRFLEWMIPDIEEKEAQAELEPLDESLITALPEAAMSLSKRQTIEMAKLSRQSFQTSLLYLEKRDPEDFTFHQELEVMINKLDRELTRYLLEIGKEANLTEDNRMALNAYLEAVNNLERIGDLSINLSEMYQRIFEHEESFSPSAMEDLNMMYQLILDLYDRSIAIFQEGNLKEKERVYRDEEYINLIERKYREKHFQRMSDGLCPTEVASSLYTDILSHLERIADHSINIVKQSEVAILEKEIHDGIFI